MTASFAVVAAPQVTAQEGVRSLEEVVVTARRREESLQEVPVSISVLTSDALIDGGIVTDEDLFTLVPGLDYDTTQFGTRQGSEPGMRGAQSNQAVTLRQKVMTFVDGIPTSSGTGATSLLDVGRVEVYRGPQSSAFGRATFGGAINYVSREPGDEFDAQIRAELSDLGRQGVTVQLGGPINDQLGFTFDFLRETFDAPDEWVSNDGQRLNENEMDYYSGKLVYTPTDSMEFKLRYIRQEFDDADVARYHISPQAYQACTQPIPGASANPITGTTGRWVVGEFDCDMSLPAGGIPRNMNIDFDTVQASGEALGLTQAEIDPFLQEASFYSYVPFEQRTRETLVGQGAFDLANGQAIEVSLSTKEENGTSWRSTTLTDNQPMIVPEVDPFTQVPTGDFVLDTTGVGGFRAFTDPHEEDFAEVRWISPQDNRFRWLVGASSFSYFQHLRVYGGQWNGVVQGFLPPQAAELQNLVEEGDNYGVFGSMQYDITDQLTVSLEGRYQDEELQSTIAATGVNFTTTTEVFLPRFSLTYSFADNLTGYFQYAEGNSPAGVNAAAADPRKIRAWEHQFNLGNVEWRIEDFLDAPEEEIENYEIGLKGSLLDNQLQFAASLYMFDWSNYNFPLFLNFDPGQGARLTGDPEFGDLTFFDYFLVLSLFNEGNVESQGVEFEGTYLVNDRWTLRGTLAAQEAEFKNHCNLAAVQSIGMAPTSGPDIDGHVFNCVEVAGNTVPRVPDLTGSLSATYQAPLANSGWDFMARMDYRYRGEQFIDALELAHYPIVHWFNLNLGFMRDNYNIRLYVNNVTDEDSPLTIQSGGDNNQLDGPQNFNIVPRLPREAGLRFTYQF